MIRILGWLCIAALLLATTAGQTASAFCLCGGLPPTLREQLERADAAYLIRWVSQTKWEWEADGEEHQQLTTTFEVVETIRSGALALEPRAWLTVPYHIGRDGESFVACGTLERDEGDQQTGEIYWNLDSITPAGCDYLRNVPRQDSFDDEEFTRERLKFYVRYLEHEDRTIAEDAHQECERIPAAELACVAEFLPRDKLRNWLQSETVAAYHRQLYATMLGLCGTPADAELLQRLILNAEDDDSYGAYGLIVGYLLLAGERGADVLDRQLLQNQSRDPGDGQYYLNTLVSLQQEFPLTIGAERLCASARLALDRVDLAAEGIESLARLHDWSVQDRVIQLYDSCGYEDEAIKQAIVRYLDESSEPESDDPSDRAVQARRFLAQVEQRDPDSMSDDIFLEIDEPAEAP